MPLLQQLSARRIGAKIRLTGIVNDIIVQQAGNMDHLRDLSYSLLSPPFLHSMVPILPLAVGQRQYKMFRKLLNKASYG